MDGGCFGLSLVKELLAIGIHSVSADVLGDGKKVLLAIGRL
jgi:hypothetical protein